MAGCFETEAGVAAGDEDGLASVFFGRVGRDGEELGAQKCDGRLHVRHVGGLRSTFLFCRKCECGGCGSRVLMVVEIGEVRGLDYLARHGKARQEVKNVIH